MTIKLIATDMDGTFLTDDQTYDQARFALLYQQLQLRGMRFVVASGNQYYQLKSFFKAYPELIYVAENGAYIRDHQTVYAQHSFSAASVAAILAQLKTIAHLKVLVCGVNSAYALTTTDPQHVATMRHYYHHLAVVDRFDAIDDAILKFAISCPPAETDAIVAQLRTALAGIAEPTSSGHGDIDIIQPGRNKAAGLQELGAVLGVKLSEMAAFGDGGNDLEMLREVGLGIAMVNAQPDVKAVADQITTNNQQQGVLTAIAKLLAN
ncbi:Cof-type HAD-IIB family hydrolase [Lactiplantibacillus modestisalitolerans]|uniref:Cof-type HAD-IIB family hydrolase n=1 Tax=Lactiplantibacillus modestisalitolerans TaxID=1457219 RepID=A0ABV5WWW9_9LACO|nr:Cof-type HAD-IIB family hydrolase [Lactiplantibacillus modestisalitolerans]